MTRATSSSSSSSMIALSSERHFNVEMCDVDEEACRHNGSATSTDDKCWNEKSAKESDTNNSNKPPKKPRFRSFFRKLKRFSSVKAVQIFLGLYIAIVTFTPVGTFGTFGGFVDPKTGFIIDTTSTINTENGVIRSGANSFRAIVATSTFQMCCLAVSRVSAFFMYPALVLVFTTKFRATMSFLSTTPFSLFLIQETHDLHAYCGWIIFVDGWLHTLFHCARWIEQRNLGRLLFQHPTGISGLVIFLSLNLICMPMMFACLRNRIRFEVRKYSHYFFVFFAVALSIHVPKSALPSAGFAPIIFPTLLLWYIADWLYVQLFMTEKIDTTVFHVLPTGVQMTMKVSDAFQKRGTGGYCYVCLPWVSKSQWHAYSLFENPTNTEERQVFMLKNGDWTNAVHEVLQRDTRRPVWVQGPFHSPYRNADAYDNQILVASGIGITPALSVIRAHKDSRRTNLIWTTRDPAMLEFFLEHAYLDHRGWNLIFYTGDATQLSRTVEDLIGTNLCLIRARPNLRQVITNIIYGIESGRGLPERYIPGQREQVKVQLAQRLHELDCEYVLTPEMKLSALAAHAQELGFLFSAIVPDQHAGFLGGADSILQCLRDAGEGSVVDGGSVLSDFTGGAHTVGTDGRSTQTRQKRNLMRRRRSYHHWRSSVAPNFRPWENIPQAEKYVKSLDLDTVRSTWGMLYCGGSKPIQKTLQSVSGELQLDFHSESFSW